MQAHLYYEGTPWRVPFIRRGGMNSLGPVEHLEMG